MGAMSYRPSIVPKILIALAVISGPIGFVAFIMYELMQHPDL
jgi:uncharacterized MnhB-related membrane protein